MSTDGFSLVVTGDTILNGRVSDVGDARFGAVAAALQNADVTITHFESLIHDYAGPEVYPSAEAGWTWMRSPRSTVDELRWLGVDAVSLASNHSLDYGVGGLRSTWEALDSAGIAHAGTGLDLGTAREPVYVFRGGRKVALLSMTTSAPPSARAGHARPDLRGRPGVNPLGFQYHVDSATLQTIRSVSTALGFWVEQTRATQWLVHPPGLHNSGTTFHLDETLSEPRLRVDPDDARGNLAALADAVARSDIAIVHIHNHEWDPATGLSVPPRFVTEFARRCVDTGAAVVVVEGSHAPLRGTELYGDGVIVYDPGELFMMSGHVTKLPYDFYRRYAPDLPTPPYEASMGDVLRARKVRGPAVESPPGGYRTGDVDAGVVVETRFDDDCRLREVRLHPFDRSRRSGEHGGLPRAVDGDQAERVIRQLDDLSRPFQTRVRMDAGIGVLVRLDPDAPRP